MLLHLEPTSASVGCSHLLSLQIIGHSQSPFFQPCNFLMYNEIYYGIILDSETLQIMECPTIKVALNKLYISHMIKYLAATTIKALKE